MALILPFAMIVVALCSHAVCGQENSAVKVLDNAEDTPVALTSYGPQARLFLGTSTNTRVVTITSSTVAVCVGAFTTEACTGRRRRRRRRSAPKIKKRELTLSDASGLTEISASMVEPETSERETGRILFYPATIFTTVTFTQFADSGTTATISLACTVDGQPFQACG